MGGLLIAAAILGFVLPKNLFPYPLWVSFAVPIIGGLGGLLFVLGRRLSVKSAEELMAEDRRPPVVYLRSFRSDGELASSHGVMFGLPSSNAEQIVGRIMCRIGPFVAIGKPGERMPELGAARLYVGNDEWQARISEMLEVASLVLLRVGSTEGFWWEVKRVVEQVSPERVLFLVNWPAGTSPAIDEAKYQAFKERADTLLPHPVPAELNNHCFLAFDDQWQPMLLGSVRKMWQAGYYNKEDFIATDLRPVLKRYGLRVRHPMIVSRTIVWLCIILLAAGAIFIVMVNNG